ncbi:non-ribosomal peptide synthetase [Marinobacter qingdaonensis]|uniref:Amino acid adenylation domain-containing protein n=1 Tax=Marinobacter qingdaonensis TaxID=3108486 RepID=A0ABU5P1C9_9GAMM|nr:non-ribosomal peptide synthetase [Marinobacter sp. ASW11-75]MEA1081856.1 amino acid adenylation domain-containing protein [Marinobacter sp. ASW11-75]
MNTAVLKYVDRHDPFQFGNLEGTIVSTESQREVWLAAQFGDEASAAFNESVFINLKGPVNLMALTRALDALWQRHQAMRGCFSNDGEQMVIYQDRPAPILVHDFITLPEAEKQQQLDELARSAVTEAFDLFNGPLARLDVIQIDNTDTRVLLTLHHSICDGWSLYILASELGNLYSETVDSNNAPALEPPPRFSDYADWERSEYTESLREQSAAYWTARFASGIPTLDLPYDRPRPLSRSFAAYRLDTPLPMDLLKGLKTLAAKNSSTITTTLMAAFVGYLHRISGCADIVLGIPFAGQMAKQEHSLVGHCVNIIPLYIQVSAEDSFETLLRKTQQQMLEAFEHQYLTYGTLLQTLGVARDPSKPPLVSVIFNVDQANESDFHFAGLEAAFASNPRAYENFDLNLNITLSDRSAVMECTHNLQLWDTATMRQRMAELQLLMDEVLKAPDAPLGQHRLLTDEALALYREQWRSVHRDYDLDNTSLHGLVEAAAERFPDRIALVFEDHELTFRELDARANRLAHWLREQQVTADSIVPILMDRSIEMLVAINGILKAGGAYLPLDPDHPRDRLAFILEEVKARFVLTLSGLQPRVPDSVQSYALDGSDLPLDQFDDRRPECPFSPSQLAYVIYTSGSTGKPKGVLLEHRSICNHMLWMQEAFPLMPSDAVMLKTPYTFDVSLCELFLPLMVGCKLVIAKPGGHKDPDYLASLIRDQGISHIHFVPSLVYLFLDAYNQTNCPSVRRILLTGEAVSTELETRMLAAFPDAECWNLYGPTEAAVHASWWQCGRLISNHSVPIGTALPNTRLYVVDNHLHLLAPGLVGELLIAGIQVARGYMNRPELTADRFIQDPFSDAPFRAYRTGDLVKMRADGVLDYMGRNDFQVKLRGLRIELGEIESVILKFSGITQCAVLAREDRKNDQRLVAYLVSSADLGKQLQDLKEHIGHYLPEYMLPQHFIQLPTLPLTSSGKVDRKALPEPDRTLVPKSEFVLPATQTESELCALWADVLGLQSISVTENFFDAGGHSLLGTQMLSQIKSRYGISFGLGKLFEASSVRAMAKLIEQNSTSARKLPPIRQVDQEAIVYATPQQQVWFLHEEIVPDSHALTLPALFRFRGTLDVRALEQAFNTILQRHQILRANFINPQGEVEIVINHDRAIDLKPRSPADYGASDIQSLEEALREEAANGFDVGVDALFKVSLIRVGDQDHMLFLMIHHMVFDGWSFDLLLKEMCTLYNAYRQGLGNPLPALPVQFRDFAVWQREWLNSDVMDAHLDYWKTRLGGELPVLQLPTDFERPYAQPHRSEGVKFELDGTTVAGLEALAIRHQTTFFMVLLTLYVLMLHRFTRQSDLIINVPVYARNQDELSHLMGPMINVMVCRFKVTENPSLESLLTHVKDTLLEAIEHQDAPFDLLVRTINPTRDTSRNPIAQTLFNYQDVRNRQDQMDGIERFQINLDRVGVETDLDVWFKRHTDGLQAGFEYPVQLFERGTIEGFLSYFKDSAVALCEQQDDIRLESLVCANKEEKAMIAEWNQTEVAWSFNQGFLGEFQKQVNKQGDKPASVDDRRSLSYASLDQRANRLARFFAEQGVEAGDVVALLLPRDADLPATVMALWKLGAAYVPLDPVYPEERIRAILAVAQPKLLATTSDQQAARSAHSGLTVLMDQEQAAIDKQPTDPIPCALAPETLAYVIFTSGSTGVPKGVEISHGALHNFLLAVAREPGLKEQDRLLAITTLAFDISLLELFLPLSVGATVVIATAQDGSDPHRLIDLINEQAISTLQATPATWRLMLNAGFAPERPIKGLIGGEKLPPDLAESLLGCKVELWNMYGPTEATVWTSCHRVAEGKNGARPRILIGRPLANTQLHVLDDQGECLPLGVYGELWIGGAGLAQGYRANPEQTANRFVTTAKGERLYRTGDLARWTRDGQIEFGDRVDNQVKVRGYRIELEEIEVNLRSHPNVADAAVVVQDLGADDHRLIAHLTYAGDDEPTGTELRKYLRRFLPDYMMPQQFTAHDHLPLLPSGKVNRKLLTGMQPSSAARRVSHRAPTDTENGLMEIWKVLLKRDDFALEDQFLDVGGHSLLALKVIVEIEHAFGARLMPQDLWVNTLEQLANLIDQKRSQVDQEPEQPSTEKVRKTGRGVFRRLFGAS